MLVRQPSVGACPERDAPRAVAPVVYSTLSPDALLAELAGAHTIAGRARCELLQRGLNDTYLVRAGAERYIARLYRAGSHTPAEIAYELELLLHLAGRGVSVSVPIAWRDGRLQRPLAAPEGSRQLVLFSYAAGSPLAWEREEHSAIAGRLAASVHAAADDFACAHPRRPLDLEELVERPLAAVRPFLAHRPGDWRELVGIAARLRERIADAADAGLDWGVCHGDLNVKNIHAGAGAATLFDFDFCGPGWRAFDLAAGPYYAVPEGRPGIWEAFLSGYGEIRALSPGDRESIPALHAAARLWSVGLKARRAAESGTMRMSDRRFDALLASLRERPLGSPRRRPSDVGLVARAEASPARRRPPPGSLPVVYSTLSPDALLAELAGAHTIAGRARCELLQRGLNDTYLVRAGGERYIARLYRAGSHTPAEIAYELELLLHLAGRGVSVSVPIAWRDGRLQRPLAAPEGSRQLVLFSYAAGSPLAWEREEHSAIAGRLAASVHAAADDFACAHPRRPLDLEELVERPLAAVRPFLAHRPGDWRELVGIAARLRERIADAADAGLDWGVCHGDLGAGNLHVNERGAATLFDFDFCGPGWRAYDLVAPWRMSSHTAGGATWRAFLRGYGQVRRLSPIDRAAMPLLDMADRVWSLGLRAARAQVSGTARMADWYIDRVLASLSGAAEADRGWAR